MTKTAERAQRLAQVWSRTPDLTEAEAEAEVDAELELERQAQEATDRRTDEFAASLDRMWTCPSCGAANSQGLCAGCTLRNFKLDMDAAAKTPDGRNRDGLVRAYRARIGQ